MFARDKRIGPYTYVLTLVYGSDRRGVEDETGRQSLAGQVQSFPGSKPATGTAVDISVPSIRNTRPCDADRRTFNAS
jgi:hypothetical protein